MSYTNKQKAKIAETTHQLLSSYQKETMAAMKDFIATTSNEKFNYKAVIMSWQMLLERCQVNMESLKFINEKLQEYKND